MRVIFLQITTLLFARLYFMIEVRRWVIYTLKRGFLIVSQQARLTYGQLSAFFIPLGISASLTSITHVIINGTLSRGDHAAFIIASYAVAMSLLDRKSVVWGKGREVGGVGVVRGSEEERKSRE